MRLNKGHRAKGHCAKGLGANKWHRADIAGRHAVALGLAIVSLTASERAAAECTPPTTEQRVVRDTEVKCAGTTTNQNTNGNNRDGYGTGNETNITVNVRSDASVTGDRAGLIFNTGTVNNLGTISGGAFGISGVNTALVNNSGTISAGGFGIVTNGTATVTNFSTGTISAAGTRGDAIAAGKSANVTNFGKISVGLGGFGIRSLGTADVTNSGTISAGDGGVGVQANSTAIVTNSGTMSVGPEGVGVVAGTAIVTNSGTISAGDFGIGIFGISANVTNFGKISVAANGFGIRSLGTADVLNSGTISAGPEGVGVFASNIATVTNTSTGTISAGPGGFGVLANNIAIVTNSGTISAGSLGVFANNIATVTNFSTGTISAGGAGVFAGDVATVTNFGRISAGATGIGIASGNSANVTNFGTISTGRDGFGISAFGNAIVTNSGTISAAAGNGVGILANTATVTNSGTIIGGDVAIASRGGAFTITNSGTIIGNSAIALSASADTLTLLPGSRIIGRIDMGGGNDVVNFRFGGGIGQLVTLENFTGIINTSGPGLVFHSATQIAALDPTAFGLADRSLLDFTGSISGLVQGRLAGADANGRPSTGAIAVSYGPDDRKFVGKAPSASYAAPYVVWTEGFGGTRTQKATDDLLRATSTAWGGVIGVDRQVRSDLLFGAFVGGGISRLSVPQSTQRVDTDHVVGGVYGRFDWVSQFFDFKLQGGGNDNKSTRQVFNNLAPNGLENATASYGGWFISPEIAYGLRYGLGNGYTLTPMARVRYVAGALDGFSEAVSGPGLSFGRRTLQNVEERGEIELARTSQFGLTDTVRTYMHGGVIALQRLGDTTFNTTLTGQSFTFATPGKDSAVGAVAGAGFDLTVNGKVSVFGAVEGTVMSDKSRAGTAKGGMRVAF